MNTRPSIVVALHGHLPFVHHPEFEFFLEEDWFFEAVADCYVPLLLMLDGWQRDGVQAQFTLGLSPPLLSMMALPLLRERTVRALEARLSLSSRALFEMSHDNAFRPAAQRAYDDNARVLQRYLDAHLDLARAFAHHHDGGRVELITCNATHGLVPVLLDEASTRAQVVQALATHERCVGMRPRGIWLPECGMHPYALDVLASENLLFTFSEDRAVRFAWPPPVSDVYRPVYSSEGIAVFPRDPSSAKEVWSAEEGYPGDGRYREFYRDLGYDADERLLDAVHRQGTGARKNVGVKLHAVTSRGAALDGKRPYDPHAADAAVAEHAAHFVKRRTDDLRVVAAGLQFAPCLTAAFDAELFGHWWHEVPQFLDAVFRGFAAQALHDPTAPAPLSPTSYLSQEPVQQVVYPAVSSWGDGGAFSVWVNPQNEWLWRHIHDGRVRLGASVRQFFDHRTDGNGGLRNRLLQQATRELMLAQSSDWPFILTMGTQTGYANTRPVVHLARMHRLLDGLWHGDIRLDELQQQEERDALFPEVDPRWFA
jgi:1,4-alpha-glucan branching enzyme